MALLPDAQIGDCPDRESPSGKDRYFVIKLMGKYLVACCVYYTSSSPVSQLPLGSFGTDDLPQARLTPRAVGRSSCQSCWVLLRSLSQWLLWIPAGWEERQQTPAVSVSQKLTLDWGCVRRRGCELTVSRGPAVTSA